MNKVFQKYAGIYSALSQYWATYGAFRELCMSPFAHVALVVTLICFPIWWAGQWWATSLTVVPSVLGFSIAAFALLLGVGDDRFKQLLGRDKKNGKSSTLKNTSAGFMHFIVVQVLAIIFALVGSAQPIMKLLSFFPSFDHASSFAYFLGGLSKTFRFVGFFLLAYSLLTALAATLNIFTLATLFSKYASKGSLPKPQDEKKGKKGDGGN